MHMHQDSSSAGNSGLNRLSSTCCSNNTASALGAVTVPQFTSTSRYFPYTTSTNMEGNFSHPYSQVCGDGTRDPIGIFYSQLKMPFLIFFCLEGRKLLSSWLKMTATISASPSQRTLRCCSSMTTTVLTKWSALKESIRSHDPWTTTISFDVSPYLLFFTARYTNSFDVRDSRFDTLQIYYYMYM